jgi:hypothetical protein
LRILVSSVYWKVSYMNRIESKLQFCLIAFMISVLGGLGCVVLTGCMVNEAQRLDSSQTIKNQKQSVNQEPTATSTPQTEVPPPTPPWKPATYQEMHKSFSLRLRKKIREKEKEIGLQSIENLLDSASEIRLWYFPSQEKMRGMVFSRSDELKPLIKVFENSKEEMPLNKESFEKLTRIFEQSNIENLKDTKSIEFTPSTGDSYLVYQIKSGQKVSFKIYVAGVGSNVEPTQPCDLCDAAELCRKLSELLSLDFNDCKCSPPKEAR